MAKSYRLRVSIVEDDAPTASEFEIAISRVADTKIASNEDQVLFQLAGFKPDVMILDITLASEKKYPPRTAGVRILEHIREQPSPAGDLPVIVVTARVEDEIEDRCREIGVFDYFRKPVKSSTLREAIKAAARPAPKNVFISYSTKDKGICEELMTHLKPPVRQGLVSPWRRVDTPAGADWRKRLNDELLSAQVAVLLVSARYFASEFVNDHELPYLLEAAYRDELTILWTSASYVEIPPSLARFRAARSPDVPLDALAGPDLAKGLGKLGQEILKAAGRPARPGIV